MAEPQTQKTSQAKPADAKKASAPEKTAPVNITYIPRPGDPVTTVWGKLTFEANKPRPVSDPRLIEKAKKNPWFKVEGEKQAEASFDPGTDAPVNSTQYRAYAITWFKVVTKSADMQKRWSDEEALRTECEVGQDDLEYLARFYDPRLEQLVNMERAGEAR
jgi:hypothetical protein